MAGGACSSPEVPYTLKGRAEISIGRQIWGLAPQEHKGEGGLEIARPTLGWRDMAGTSDRRKGLVARTWGQTDERNGKVTVRCF